MDKEVREVQVKVDGLKADKSLNNLDDAGRQVMMDRVEWYDGWPLVSGAQSSIESNRPYFNKE